MPTPNTELLRRTLDHVKAHPQEWDQDTFRTVGPCGTTMCFAGWAVTLAGSQWASGPNWGGDFLRAESDDVWGRTFYVAELGHAVIPAAERARRLLGITREEAWRLFRPSNDLTDLERVVDQLCEQAAVDRLRAELHKAVDHIEPTEPGR